MSAGKWTDKMADEVMAWPLKAVAVILEIPLSTLRAALHARTPLVQGAAPLEFWQEPAGHKRMWVRDVDLFVWIDRWGTDAQKENLARMESFPSWDQMLKEALEAEDAAVDALMAEHEGEWQ